MTKKERDILLLIVRGHDAKSMADELGFSVHTINECVCNARRMIDAADWLDSFDCAATSLANVNSLEYWPNASRKVREPFGRLVSGELQTIRNVYAPPRGYQEVTFAARYTSRDRVV